MIDPWAFLDCVECKTTSLKDRDKKVKFELCKSCDQMINNLRMCPDCNQVVDHKHYRNVNERILGMTGLVQKIVCPKAKSN